MLRALYDFTMRLGAHRRAPVALAGISFAESSFFPIPPDVLLIPMVLAERTKAWRYAFICTVASVLGGLFGYFIGFALFETIGQPVLAMYGYSEKFAEFAARYNEWGAWIVFIAGVTPFPYKVVTIASGATMLDPLAFILASIAARGFRFFLVAALLYWFGPPVRAFIEKRLGLVFAVGMALLVGGFAAIRYL